LTPSSLADPSVEAATVGVLAELQMLHGHVLLTVVALALLDGAEDPPLLEAVTR